LGIREVPKSGTIVGHGVGRARDVVMAGDIAVKALVQGLEP